MGQLMETPGTVVGVHSLDYISSWDHTNIHYVCVFVITLVQGRTRAVGAQRLGFFLGVGRVGSRGTWAGR